MEKWRPLDEDNTKVELFWYDEDTQTQHVKTVYKHTDVILDANKSIQGEQAGRDAENHFWEVARIPPSIQHLWLQEGLDIYNREHGARLMKKLDDPEWKYLRVQTGRIGRRSGHI